MTNEEKQLILKVLCEQLPYGVMIKDTYSVHYGRLVEIGNTFAYFVSELNGNTLDIQLYHAKPYLRPLSSMTEEEKELMKGSVICFNELEGNCTLFDEEGLDWLNTNHFDYRGLIEKGLALESPEGMYKIE